MKQLIIIGAGGFAREVCDMLPSMRGFCDEWRFKGFLDGTARLEESAYKILQAPVLGDIASYRIQNEDVFACAIGDPLVKEQVTHIVEEKGGKFINLIHKTATISDSAVLGTGNILCKYSSVNANAWLGNYIMVNNFSQIAHDAKIGSYTSIMCYVDITGGVIVGEKTFWGSGARALPHSKIGAKSLIGAGSLVLKRVNEGQHVLGVPAKPIPL